MGHGKTLVPRLETLLQGDQKILSEVITFVLKSILDTQGVQRLPWLCLQPAVSRASFREDSPSGHLEPEKLSETGKLNSWGRISAEELAGATP